VTAPAGAEPDRLPDLPLNSVIRPDYDASLASLLRPDLAQPGGSWSILLEDGPHPPERVQAECARLAYCRFEEDPAIGLRLREALARAGYAKLQTFDIVRSATRGFAAYDPVRREAIVAFRGTQADQIRDIALDLQVTVQPWPTGGTVHRGFATAAANILPDVRRWLDTEAADRTSLVLTGHSLGAAIAVLAASQWRPERVAAFGCPRVGNRAFALGLAALRIDRWCNCCDLVCRLPPQSQWYTHVGTQRYISRLGHRLHEPGPRVIAADQLAARADYLWRHFWRFGTAGARELADHSMINYLRAFL
jgi:hypothetical protein